MAATLEPLFSVPIYRCVREVPLTADEHRAVEALEYISNRNNAASVHNDVLHQVPGLRAIGAFCQACVDQYMREVVGTDDPLRITISWANRTSQGQNHHQHLHVNSVLSGSFYFQDTSPAPIIFTNPLRAHSNFEFNQEGRPANQFNAASRAVAAPPNSCVLFPSWMRHEVPPLPPGAPDRYSIAFNTFLVPNHPYGSDLFRTSIRW